MTHRNVRRLQRLRPCGRWHDDVVKSAVQNVIASTQKEYFAVSQDKIFIEPRPDSGFGAKHEHGQRSVVTAPTYEELEQVSLLLASRAGLSTAEESMAEVATKIAELVAT